MSEEFYLIFELSNAYFGIPAIAVQEIFSLPEITPSVEVYPYVIGMINLRGEILPLVALSHLLGQSSSPLQLSDSVVIVQWQNQRVGVVVHQVCEVQAIAPDNIQTNLTYQRTLEDAAVTVITGIATLESTLITLVNPACIIQAATVTANSNNSDANKNGVVGFPSTDQKQSLYSHWSLEEQRQLESRTRSLSQKFSSQDDTQLTSIAVLQLGGEYFGVGLELIHELIDIRKLTAIPCCPTHILGNMNLRGEIVTLIDISHVLNLPTLPASNRQKAIVIHWNKSNIGIAVDDIVDVMEFDPQQILPVPVAIHSSNDEYLQGITAYHDGMMSLINLPKVLMADTLVVNENF